MSFTVRDQQARIAALGFNPGPIDGKMGPMTRQARSQALASRHGSSLSDLFHVSGLHRIHWHWTAGAYGIISLEKRAYNYLIDENGDIHDGLFRAEAQANYRVGHAASHTLNANTGAIGVSIDAMAGAKENPFDWGKAPITEQQIDQLVDLSAELGLLYDIPPMPTAMLSHAEVQETLGIRQKWKWDIKILPGMERPQNAIVIGNILRERVRVRMEQLS